MLPVEPFELHKLFALHLLVCSLSHTCVSAVCWDTESGWLLVAGGSTQFNAIDNAIFVRFDDASSPLNGITVINATLSEARHSAACAMYYSGGGFFAVVGGGESIAEKPTALVDVFKFTSNNW